MPAHAPSPLASALNEEIIRFGLSSLAGKQAATEIMTDHRILNPGSNCWDICEANKTGSLVDARDYTLEYCGESIGG